MSASICWRALPTTNQTLDVAAPSSFLAAMTRAFQSGAPWTLGEGDLPVLRGMAAAHGGSHRDNPFEQLIHLIDDGGSPRTIEVWAQY